MWFFHVQLGPLSFQIEKLSILTANTIFPNSATSCTWQVFLSLFGSQIGTSHERSFLDAFTIQEVWLVSVYDWTGRIRIKSSFCSGAQSKFWKNLLLSQHLKLENTSLSFPSLLSLSLCLSLSLSLSLSISLGSLSLSLSLLCPLSILPLAVGCLSYSLHTSPHPSLFMKISLLFSPCTLPWPHFLCFFF